jgi:hypothetical protein
MCEILFLFAPPLTALFLDVVRISGLRNVDKITQHPDRLGTERACSLKQERRSVVMHVGAGLCCSVKIYFYFANRRNIYNLLH